MIRWDDTYFERAVLESPFRILLHSPDKILRELELKSGENFLDIGCGTGFLVKTASKIVGDGKVYALDNNTSYLREVSKKVELYNLENVIILEDSAEDMSTVLNESIDKAIMFFSLHHFKDRRKALENTYKKLRKNGSLLIVDPISSRSLGHGTNPREILRISLDIGYELVKYHSGIMNYKMLLKKEE
ncbi:MAG: class I SAM-dependent methyltransferase [Candidatus Caldarchaeales archaeon]